MSIVPNLDRVLADHHAPIDAAEFLQVLAEATDSTDTLTAAERAFLVEQGGVPSDSVDITSQAKALQQMAVSRAAATSKPRVTATPRIRSHSNTD